MTPPLLMTNGYKLVRISERNQNRLKRKKRTKEVGVGKESFDEVLSRILDEYEKQTDRRWK